jgi:hypothetical protein
MLFFTFGVKIDTYQQTLTFMKNTLLLFALLITSTSFGQTWVKDPYCYPPSTIGTFGGAIINVSIGTLNNTSGMVSDTFDHPSNFGYTYFNNLTPPVLYRDSTYTLSVTFDTVHGTADVSWYDIAIAFDTTGASFTHPINFTANGAVGTTTMRVIKTFTVTVPHSAALDTVRMRIVRYGAAYSGGSHVATPCYPGGSIYGDIGETEDYKLRIMDAASLNVKNVAEIGYIIYPNPTNGPLHFSGSGITLYNTLGQKVGSFPGQDADISYLPAGIYYADGDGRRSIVQKQ